MGPPPPPSAFGMSGSTPPPSAFGAAATLVTPDNETPDDETPRTGGTSTSLMSTNLNDRWNQYETSMESHRSQSSQDPKPPAPSAGLNPRQPYSFKKTSSSSYNTDDLIRKYGGIAGIPPTVTSTRTSLTTPTATSTVRPSITTSTAAPATSSSPKTPAPLTVRPADVRQQAQRVLDMFDDQQLQKPIDIQRTQSGGFRAAAPVMVVPPAASASRSESIEEEEEVDPYAIERTTSGRRVPSALSGLNMGTKSSPAWNKSGRYSFSDPSFRDDDHISDDEDDIVQIAPFKDEPIVDVARMENRSAAVRPYSDNPDKQFEGDYEGGSKAWSSRYSDASAYTPRKNMMEQWDREFEQNQQKNKGPLIMFMGSAKTIRSSARNVLSKANNQKDKIFGFGGFDFRSNHVFGKHKSGNDSEGVNLRTVWKDVDEDSIIQTPKTHKTWQEVMLNKRKRRRCLAIFVLLVLGLIAAAAAGGVIARQAAKYKGPNMGSEITFYVTSDTPFDSASESQLSNDLVNIPMDSEFLFHLGNIQKAAVNYCPNTRYGDVASVLKKSPVPVFIVPGEEDWTRCPSPPISFLHWNQAFYDFDLEFKHSFDVKRDEQHREAFAFLYNGVLFMGLHVVGGPVYNIEEWTEREKEMLRFYFGMSNMYKGQFRSVVLMGNARPSPQQNDFFTALFSNLKSHSAPVTYLHANQFGDSVLRYNPFEGHPEVEAIGIQDGSKNPPLKITVGFGANPVIIG